MQNTIGNVEGHCGVVRPNDGPNYFVNCSEANRACGVLHCEGGSYINNLNETVHRNDIQVNDSNGNPHQCLSFTTLSLDFEIQNPGLVSQWTSCGPNMVAI